MSLPHFYLDDQVLAAEGEAVFPLRLSREDAKHARVLRLAPGEHVAVVDAVRDYFECAIVSFDDVVPMVRIARHREAREDGPSVLLVQGLAKGDRMETVIRHATELGVCAFLPLECERSVVKLDARKAAAKAERWRAVAKSAAMQSGQPFVPEVCEPRTLAQVCDVLRGATAVLVCWEEAPTSLSLGEALRRGMAAVECRVPADARVAVVVGPEGGLSEAEVERILACNPRAALVSLGSSILRTETAGIVAPALALYELGRLGGGSCAGASDARMGGERA